jgi:hypothetical protein
MFLCHGRSVAQPTDNPTPLADDGSVMSKRVPGTSHAIDGEGADLAVADEDALGPSPRLAF